MESLAAEEDWSSHFFDGCVLLAPDGRCSVYRLRPLICRTHYVLSPPDDCRPERR